MSDTDSAAFRRGMTQAELEAFIDHAIERMTLREKIRAIHGRATLPRLAWDVLIMRHYNRRPYEGGGVRRFGIPPLRFTDGPRGVSAGHSTCFPAAIARAATWNVPLHERVGDVIGRECRANGATYYGGVCVNLLTHPAGGRAQESYGEAPHLIGEMGAALVRGVQRHNVMACVKHYACNNIEDTRFKVNVNVDERTLREVYLLHFRTCIRAGAASVMAAYNRVRGDWCCEHEYLLSTILKGEWGFTGFVMSDFNFGIHTAEAAASGGLDIEMGGRKHFNMRRLGAAVRAGRVDTSRLNDAVRRVVGTTLAFANREDPERYDRSRIAAVEHTALAREVAEEAMVLLKNEPAEAAGGGAAPILPVDPDRVKRIALLGRLAEKENTGDHGSSSVYPHYVITAADGLRDEAEERGVEVTMASGATGGGAARRAAAADVAVVVVGLDHRDEGEGGVKLLGIGGDRDSLGLHAVDIDLIQTVAAANPRTVVVL
ncbi:MAG: glycoside hydrolase family 3 N-terminal domain-containing protein, partial [Spirochaetaceae bacterium]